MQNRPHPRLDPIPVLPQYSIDLDSKPVDEMTTDDLASPSIVSAIVRCGELLRYYCTSITFSGPSHAALSLVFFFAE